MAILWAWIASIALASSHNGLYRISGQDQENGSYTGQAQIQGSEVIRQIRYNNFKFKSHTVEVIWAGHIENGQLNFRLKPSQALISFDNYRVPLQAFQNPLNLSAPLTTTGTLTFLKMTENWSLQSSHPGVNPIWENQRIRLPANGEQAPWFVHVANFLALQKVLDTYEIIVAHSKWGFRDEVQKHQHWIIQDPTDFEFYRKTPSIVRVTNKTVNPASLAEALMRKNAYSPSLKQKATYFETETQHYNLNSAGVLELALVGSDDHKWTSQLESDSALWTGVYVWTQALRYRQSQDPQAYENMTRALKGILNLVHITEDPHQFARTIIESSDEEKIMAPGLVQGSGVYARYKWQQIGNNDMSKGLLIALVAAYPVLKSADQKLRLSLQDLTTRLLQLEPIQKKDQNLRLAYGLQALYNQNTHAFREYKKRTESLGATLANKLDLDSGFYFGSIADWSGIHLSTISTTVDILLAEELRKVFTLKNDLEFLSETQAQAENLLFSMSQVYKPAHRHFLTLFAYAFTKKAQKSDVFRWEARNALWALREIPAPRFVGTAQVDHRLNPEWSLSAFPSMPWKALKGPFEINMEKLNLENHGQGAYMFPLFESAAWSSTFLWKENPFRIQESSQSNRVIFSTDYLLLYRIARQAELISEDD